MLADYTPQIITGLFVFAAAAGGALLGGVMTRAGDRRRVKAEDERGWLADRRTIYARYLGMCKTLLEQVDKVGVFLPYDAGDPLSDEDDEIIRDDLDEYWRQWEQLQPVLSELQLLATPQVADIADRVSGALMDITGPIETRRPFYRVLPAVVPDAGSDGRPGQCDAP